MKGQVSIGDPGDPTPLNPPVCRWCGERAIHELEVTPKRRQLDKRTRTFDVIPALMAPCCSVCFARVEAHKAEAKARRVARKAAERELRGK